MERVIGQRLRVGSFCVGQCLLVIGLLLMTGVCIPLIGQDNAAQESTDNSEKAITHEIMIEAIVAKNIFKPARVTSSGQKWPKAIVVPELGPQSLNRPFTVIGIDHTEKDSRVHLLFNNPTERRVVIVGDEIETVVLKEIHSTYVICVYDGQEVRVDVGETSDDALNHIKGFNDFSDFVGTTTVGDESYATFIINGRYRRVGVGDWLGDYEVMKIDEGKLWLKLVDEPPFVIEASSRE